MVGIKSWNSWDHIFLGPYSIYELLNINFSKYFFIRDICIVIEIIFGYDFKS